MALARHVRQRTAPRRRYRAKPPQCPPYLVNRDRSPRPPPGIHSPSWRTRSHLPLPLHCTFCATSTPLTLPERAHISLLVLSDTSHSTPCCAHTKLRTLGGILTAKCLSFVSIRIAILKSKFEMSEMPPSRYQYLAPPTTLPLSDNKSCDTTAGRTMHQSTDGAANSCRPIWPWQIHPCSSCENQTALCSHQLTDTGSGHGSHPRRTAM